MLNRKIVAAMVCLLLVFLTACGGGGTKSASNSGSGSSSGTSTGGGNTSQQSAEKPKENVTLDFVWFTDGVEGDVMKSIIADYQKDNPHVTINLNEVAYNDLETKLKTTIAGGKPPAIARVTNPGAFVNQALDLTPYVGDVDQFMSQFLESVKPYYYIGGKIVSVPMEVTANGLIYNKTLFDQAGVSVPQSPDEIWTWDEFTEALKQVMDKGGARYGMVWDFTPHRWSTILYQFGGSIFNEDGTAAAINSDAGVRAVEYFAKLHKDGIMPESVWLGGENPNNLFRSGTVAAHWSGNWMISNYKDIDNFEWGVTYMPKGVQRSSVPGGKYIMAFQGSGVEEEAANFIKYVSSKEVNAKYTSESFFISSRLDNAELEYEFGSEMFAVFANELSNTPPAAAMDWSRQEVVPKFQGDLRDEIVEVLAGSKTAQQALADVEILINKAIEEAK